MHIGDGWQGKHERRRPKGAAEHQEDAGGEEGVDVVQRAAVVEEKEGDDAGCKRD